MENLVLTRTQLHHVDVCVWADLALVGIFLGVVNHGLLDTSEEHVVLGTDPGERVAGPCGRLLSLLVKLFPLNVRWLQEGQQLGWAMDSGGVRLLTIW